MLEQEILDYLDHLGKGRRVSENTKVSYGTNLRKMACYMEEQRGRHFAAEVTEEDLEAFVTYLEEERGYVSATVYRYVFSAKSFFRFLYAKEYIAADPAENLIPPVLQPKVPKILSFRQVDMLLQQPAGDSPRSLRDKAMLELLYATGIRVGELIRLKTSDVIRDAGYIQCRTGKRLRCIPFGSSVRKALDGYMKEGREVLLGREQSDVLFLNRRGKPMTRQGFRKLLRNYAAAAGIDMDITPNTLRHSFAAHLLQNGIEAKRVQELLGRSELSHTQLAAYLEHSDIQNVYQRSHPRR